MIFDDKLAVINCIRCEALELNKDSIGNFQKYNDPEITRMFASSPPVAQQAATYCAENSLYKPDTQEDDEKLALIRKKESAGNVPIITSSKLFNQISASVKDPKANKNVVDKKMFESVPVSKNGVGITSLLSANLVDPNLSKKSKINGLSGAEVTIYLPDRLSYCCTCKFIILYSNKIYHV